jgi:hypothetical protein
LYALWAGPSSSLGRTAQIRGSARESAYDARPASAAAAEHLDVEIADLLAQRVAIDPEQIGGPDLVAAGGRSSSPKVAK